MLLQLRINILEGFADKNTSCLSKLLPRSTDFSGGFLSYRCFILALVNHSPFSGSFSDPECLLLCFGTAKMCNTKIHLESQKCVIGFERLLLY